MLNYDQIIPECDCVAATTPPGRTTGQERFLIHKYYFQISRK